VRDSSGLDDGRHSVGLEVQGTSIPASCEVRTEGGGGQGLEKPRASKRDDGAEGGKGRPLVTPFFLCAAYVEERLQSGAVGRGYCWRPTRVKGRVGRKGRGRREGRVRRPGWLARRRTRRARASVGKIQKVDPREIQRQGEIQPWTAVDRRPRTTAGSWLSTPSSAPFPKLVSRLPCMTHLSLQKGAQRRRNIDICTSGRIPSSGCCDQIQALGGTRSSLWS
jgi:hypothetical protein